VLDTLCSERFVDKSPREVFASLLDEGTYLCSISTFYRILRANNCAKERRAVVRRTHYARPELLAQGPNEVWSWDITKIKGAQKWTYFYLYVMIDIFSRYVVGWMVATRENAQLAKSFIRETLAKYSINPEDLTIHSDRGAPMTAKTTSQLHADLGVLQSLSRPHVSNDNPFSEAAFKTIKYSAGFPDRFSNAQIARSFCNGFFDWYNKDHRHVGLQLFTPEMVHFGLVDQVAAKRQATLDAAYARNPSRFSKMPMVKLPDTAVYINPPESSSCASRAGGAEQIVVDAQDWKGEPKAITGAEGSNFGEGRSPPLNQATACGFT
jgi:putative transposase